MVRVHDIRHQASDIRHQTSDIRHHRGAAGNVDFAWCAGWYTAAWSMLEYALCIPVWWRDLWYVDVVVWCVGVRVLLLLLLCVLCLFVYVCGCLSCVAPV